MAVADRDYRYAWHRQRDGGQLRPPFLFVPLAQLCPDRPQSGRGADGAFRLNSREKLTTR
jgi:hypothetical protein